MLTERAAAGAVNDVARGATVAGRARGLGVGWQTVNRQVLARGAPVVDDPDRLEGVSAIGVDEHVWQRGAGGRPTAFATGIVDLTPGRPARLLDLVEGRSGAVLRGWLADRPESWKSQITTAALDPYRGYATALGDQLPHAERVLDPFHVCKLGLDAPGRGPPPRPTGHPRPPRAPRRPALPRSAARTSPPRPAHPAGLGSAAPTPDRR